VGRHASIRLYGRLLEAGVGILEYNHTMLHHKTMVVDGAWSTIGTAISTNRSFAHNEENNVCVFDRGLAPLARRHVPKGTPPVRPHRVEAWRQRSLWAKIEELVAVLQQDQADHPARRRPGVSSINGTELAVSNSLVTRSKCETMSALSGVAGMSTRILVFAAITVALGRSPGGGNRECLWIPSADKAIADRRHQGGLRIARAGLAGSGRSEVLARAWHLSATSEAAQQILAMRWCRAEVTRARRQCRPSPQIDVPPWRGYVCCASDRSSRRCHAAPGPRTALSQPSLRARSGDRLMSAVAMACRRWNPKAFGIAPPGDRPQATVMAATREF